MWFCFGLNAGKKVLKVKEKFKEEKSKPTDDKIRDEICEILKEVDFNTVSLGPLQSLKYVVYMWRLW